MFRIPHIEQSAHRDRIAPLHSSSPLTAYDSAAVKCMRPCVPYMRHVYAPIVLCYCIYAGLWYFHASRCVRKARVTAAHTTHSNCPQSAFSLSSLNLASQLSYCLFRYSFIYMYKPLRICMYIIQ